MSTKDKTKISDETKKLFDGAIRLNDRIASFPDLALPALIPEDVRTITINEQDTNEYLFLTPDGRPYVLLTTNPVFHEHFTAVVNNPHKVVCGVKKETKAGKSFWNLVKIDFL